MQTTNLYVDSKPPLNTVQPMVFEVIIMHKNIELITSDDYRDFSLGKNDPNLVIEPVLIGITLRNIISWVEVVKKN